MAALFQIFRRLAAGRWEARVRAMSKAEILGELPKLSREERREILDRLWALEEDSGPSEGERRLLEEALSCRRCFTPRTS